LRELIARHAELTGSRRAQWILDHWAEAQGRFIKVFPHEYKRVLGMPRATEIFEPANSITVDPVSAAVAAGSPLGD
jgi:glutamate synthase domain-containing protein 3